MAKAIDMTGWTMRDHNVENSNVKVLNLAETKIHYSNSERKSSIRYWNCECLICGKHFIANGENIRSGQRKDCGEHLIRQGADITGKTFNYLTALENTYKKGNDGSYIWKCQCKCGNIVEVNRHYLVKGDIKSCGCLRQENGDKKKIDMIGKTFGYLTVLSEIPERNKNKRILYRCKCKCGNYCNADGIELRNGHIKSCGCYKREMTSITSTRNLLNKKFGLLTAIELLPEPNEKGLRQWRCKCDCGNEKIASSNSLLTGKVLSCGCLKISAKELMIKTILEENNYNFLYNKEYFKDLIGVGKGTLRCDFIIFDNNNNKILRIVEYDGEQHFHPVIVFGGQENFEKQQQNDRIKNEYAWSHNIPIVRIPYTEKNITLETIMGDQYLVRPPQESENEN